jgi:hypothetical protein
MYSVWQSPFSRQFSNESLHNLQFIDATSLESAGIVKNVSVMIGEYKFILNAVLATLAQVSGKAERKYE